MNSESESLLNLSFAAKKHRNALLKSLRQLPIITTSFLLELLQLL